VLAFGDFTALFFFFGASSSTSSSSSTRLLFLAFLAFFAPPPSEARYTFTKRATATIEAAHGRTMGMHPQPALRA
jgi:hypothetical protein